MDKPGSAVALAASLSRAFFNYKCHTFPACVFHPSFGCRRSSLSHTFRKLRRALPLQLHNSGSKGPRPPHA